MKPVFATLAVLGAAVLIIAGCGSGDDGSTGSGGAYGSGDSTTTEPATEAAATGAVVSAAQTKLGRIIVDSNGLTLYDFHKDKGTTSSCYGACAQVWPPLLTDGAPRAGEGAIASKLGTTKRKDGTTQVTYAGHPLYVYVEDSKPGETNGNDFSSFGAEWYALEPSGEEPEG